VTAIVILALAGLALYLRGLNSEQRVQFLNDTLARTRAAVHTARGQIRKVPPNCETFAQALRERTRFAVVVPLILALNIAVFILMGLGNGTLSDPATLIAWGGSVGPRTANGEWWRLITSLFVHSGMLPLLGNLIGLASVGFMLERLVGPVAFAGTYIVAGVIAGVAELSAHQIAVNTGASGAIFGVYGLLVASTVWGLYGRSSATIPLAALKHLAPGSLVFLIIDIVSYGIGSEVRVVGFATGLIVGLILAAGVTHRKPAMRRVFATVAATVGIVIVLVAPLRGLEDVSADIAAVIASEDRITHDYDAVLAAANEGRSTMHDRIVLIDQIRPRLQTLRARLESFHKVPREQQPLVARALEYLKTRDESWRLRREALRKSNLQILSEADSVERMSLDRFRKLKVAASAS
jgi:rhomboid protease GluP